MFHAVTTAETKLMYLCNIHTYVHPLPQHSFNLYNLTCLQGLIDPAKELVKLQKKQDQLEQQVRKLKQAMAAPDYIVKVPEEVRLSNTDKLTQTEGELVRLLSAMNALKTMQ
jgi:valyl-tRNA synthetase